MKKLILSAFLATSLLALVACGGGDVEDDASAVLSADSDMASCKKDAMVCPDGSVVGRKLPLCEFDSCSPAVNPPTLLPALRPSTPPDMLPALRRPSTIPAMK